jgi:NarL family two-component system response regulator LiaR
VKRPVPDAVRVCIADDHAVVRRGLRAFLDSQPDIEVVGEAATGSDAVALVQRLVPNVVLVDLFMPEMDGFEAIRHMRERCPDTHVIVLTSFSAEGQVLRALRAGALSYLLKDADADEIAAAIRKAARGEAVIASTVAAKGVGKLARPPAASTAGLAHLTNRELEVLGLIADGLSNAIIAERLVITEGTVKTHVNNLLSKLQLADRTQAAVLAWRHGIADQAD